MFKIIEKILNPNKEENELKLEIDKKFKILKEKIRKIDCILKSEYNWNFSFRWKYTISTFRKYDLYSYGFDPSKFFNGSHFADPFKDFNDPILLSVFDYGDIHLLIKYFYINAFKNEDIDFTEDIEKLKIYENEDEYVFTKNEKEIFPIFKLLDEDKKTLKDSWVCINKNYVTLIVNMKTNVCVLMPGHFIKRKEFEENQKFFNDLGI